MVVPNRTVTAPPVPDVAVYGVQQRKRDKQHRPWIVRWSVGRRQRSKSFRTRNEAERYRAGLLVAVQNGLSFDAQSGEPAAWQPAPEDVAVYRWSQQWLAEQWPEWAPRTRDSAVEAIARFVALLARPLAPPPPSGLRRHLMMSLRPGGECPDLDAERWLEKWSLPLNQLSRPLLASVDSRLGLRDDGGALAPSTASRFRKVSRACVRRAVDLGVLDVDPWPPPPRGRSKRKAARVRHTVNVRVLPDPSTMERIIDALASSQPASRTYRVMTAVVYYAGLRPSEVVMLRQGALVLPKRGWGRIEVTEADIDFDVPGEPKTGPRSVPIPPQLVKILAEWVDAHQFGAGDLLFRTRTGRRPAPNRGLRRPPDARI
jgi:integrase